MVGIIHVKEQNFNWQANDQVEFMADTVLAVNI